MIHRLLVSHEHTLATHTCSAAPTPAVWLLILAERSIAGINWEITHHAMWLDTHLTGVLWIQFLREVRGGGKWPTQFFSRGKALISCVVHIRCPPEVLYAHLRPSIHARLILRHVHTAGSTVRSGHIRRELIGEEMVGGVIDGRSFSEVVVMITCIKNWNLVRISF